jgi:hypothetical protein
MRKHFAAIITLFFVLLMLSVPAMAQLNGAGSGLVGWWKMDEGAGTTVHDSSGHGHDGTFVGSPTWVSGKIGPYALSFDGSSSYVRIPSSTDFDFHNTHEYTISAWVYSKSTERYVAVSRAMSSLWHFWDLEQNTTSIFELEYTTRLVTGESSARGRGDTGWSINTWHHVVGVKYTDGTVRMYIDKVHGSDASISNPDPDLSGCDVTIGSRRSITADVVWNGYIDNVRIYNRALSAAEVNALNNERTSHGLDLDSDGKADIGVWRAASGTWFMLPTGTPGSYTSMPWGLTSDYPFPADYDGDGQADIAVWRPSEGVWYIRPSASPGTYTSTQWGLSEDKPLPADYDGDGKSDKAVWRPSTATWYVLPSGTPGTYTSTQWGLSADIPVPADYDGDGKADVAVWRRTTGFWYTLRSGTPGTYTSTQWGLSTDKPVAGDYDGDGKTDIAVWRPSSGGWFILLSGSPGSYTATQWGLSSDIPIVGDYDGDGKTDISVFRPGDGTWYILPSASPGTYISRQWGISTDVPLSAITPVLRTLP